MATALSPDLHEIAATLNTDLGGGLNPDSLRWLRDPSDHIVPDAVMALLIDGTATQDDAVLLVSNPDFPDALADAVRRAQTVLQHLSPKTAAAVHLPRASGTHNGQSYGLFPRLVPMSDNKLLRLAQKKAAAPRVTDWLLNLARETRQTIEDAADKDAMFRTPLEFVAQDADLPDEVNTAARLWLDRLEGPDAPPLFTVALHGDFWIGNVLFEPGALPGVTSGFRVIDWGGARMDGYAGIDLLRFCNSCFRPGARQTEVLMTRYLDGLGIGGQTGSLYPLASMGQLGLNLDQFPKPRYVDMVTRIFDILHRLDLAPQA